MSDVMNGRSLSHGIRRVLPYAVLALSVLAIYWKSLGFDFVLTYDDRRYVVDNPWVHGLTAENILFVFTTPYFGNYAPLHLLSYMIDYTFWGLSPGGYHLGNFVLHSINSALVFFLLKKLTKKDWAAFIAAALFAVHPANVENVAWVSERKTLLTAFFILLATASYVKFREEAGWIRHYVICVFLFLLALMSKPLAVVFPLILVCYELFMVKGGSRRMFLFPILLLPISFIASKVAVWAHVQDRLIREGTMTFEILFGEVYPNMMPVYWNYPRIIVWPFNLSSFYDITRYESFLSPVVAASFLGLLALFIAALWKGSNKVRFWFLWFWIWLLPVSNIIPIPVYYADRYMYLPAISVFVLAGEAFEWVKMRFSAQGLARPGLYLVTAAIIGFYAVLAFNRLDVWRNDLALLEDTVAKSPREDGVHIKLGTVYENMGRLKDAEREYMAAIAIFPDNETIAKLNRVRYKERLESQRVTGE